VKTFTLDWNCVIAVEKDEPFGSAVLALSRGHREGVAHAALLATSASENLKGGSFPDSFVQFERRLESADLAHLPVLNTPAVWGLTFWGRSYHVDPERYLYLRYGFWSILFPNLENNIGHAPDPEAAEDVPRSSELKKWRNAWCDVHNLITHVDHHRDVFVTANTKDFQRHADALREMGVPAIMTPGEAAQLIL
jgi:hypothetical protein